MNRSALHSFSHVKNSHGMRAVIILTKAPIPGFVKTRMSPFLTPFEGSLLQKCFLFDLAIVCAQVNASVFVFYAPESGKDLLRSYFCGDVTFFRQCAGSLGTRMKNAMETVFSLGYLHCLLLGSDCPELTVFDIEQGFNSLQHTDCVYGPAMDGGYYLVGMNSLHKDLFDICGYGGKDVLHDSLSVAQQLGLSVSLLPTRYDMDTPTDLLGLIWRLRKEGSLFSSATGRYVSTLLPIDGIEFPREVLCV